MRTRSWLVAAAVGALVAGGGVAAWQAVQRGDDDKPAAVLAFTTAEVVQPVRMPLPMTVQFSGPLVAPQTAIVRARASGTLLRLNVAEGSRVAAGQLIGTIDLSELNSRLGERSAVLDAARARTAQAERTHASNKRLADQGFISPNALDASLSALDTALADQRAAQAQLDSLRANQRDATLVAPIAGIVARRHVVEGEKLSAEQQVVTLVDLGRLELAGAVGTHEVSLLTPGMTVQVEVEGSATPVNGRLARIAPAAEPGTRSIGVTVELDNPDERLRAGQFALARVTVADAEPRLTVPATAIGQAAGQDHVWLISDGALTRRSVTLGRRDGIGGRVEVLQGLDAGAQVLAARFDNLREGARATVAAGVPGQASSGAQVASAAASTATR